MNCCNYFKKQEKSVTVQWTVLYCISVHNGYEYCLNIAGKSVLSATSAQIHATVSFKIKAKWLVKENLEEVSHF
jgi:hypothetical protein